MGPSFFRHITYFGHCGGAHTIACMISAFAKGSEIEYLKKVTNVFLLAGLYDLTDVPKTLFNNNLKLRNESALALSPLTYDFSDWSKLTFQIHVYCVEIDSPTFIKQSEELYSILKNKYHLNCLYKEYKGFDHLDILEKSNDPSNEFTKDILKTA